MTLFVTHTQAKSYHLIHSYQFQTIMKFMAYYNRKYLHDEDIIVHSVVLGDFNVGPVCASSDKVTGKMRLNEEWTMMENILREYGMRNLFYEKTEKGLSRTRNRQIVMQIQDLWYEEGARVVAIIQAQRTTRDHDPEIAQSRSTWKMDIHALLSLLRGILSTRQSQQWNREGEETLLRRELFRQILDGVGYHFPPDLIEINQIRVSHITNLVGKLFLVPTRENLAEDLIPGTALEMKDYRSLYPNEAQLCDIDHVLTPKRINGRKQVADRVELEIERRDAVKYSDHFGKRATIEVDWDRVMAHSFLKLLAINPANVVSFRFHPEIFKRA